MLKRIPKKGLLSLILLSFYLFSLGQEPPVITSQPEDLIICINSEAIFSITAEGNENSYQWEENTGSGFMALSDGSNITGSKSSVLTIVNGIWEMSENRYRCIVTNIFENSISDTAELIVNPQPEIFVSISQDTLCYHDVTGINFIIDFPDKSITGTWAYDLEVTASDPAVTGQSPSSIDKTTLDFTEVLRNNSNVVQTIKYHFTPKIMNPAPGITYCENGVDTTICIWINPRPKIEAIAIPDSLCFSGNGTAFSFSTPNTTTGTWVYDFQVVVSDPGLTGYTPNGTDYPAWSFTDLLWNNTFIKQWIDYTFTPKILDPRTGLSYCQDGLDTTIRIWTNPQPKIIVAVETDELSTEEGTNTATFMVVTPNTTTGTWVYDLTVVNSDPGVTGYSTGADRTSMNFTDLLVNNTDIEQWVDYTFTPKILSPRAGFSYCENGVDTTIRVLLKPHLIVEYTLSNYNGHNISCKGAKDGGIHFRLVNAFNPPYSYWLIKQPEDTITSGEIINSDTVAISDLFAGSYILRIENQDGYGKNYEIELKEPEGLSTSIIYQNITCHGYNDGKATVKTSGGTPTYSYYWDDAFNTTDSLVEGLSPDIYYHVTVVDLNNCTLEDSVILSQAETFLQSFIIDSTNISCYGFSDGSATISTLGGVPPYMYQWGDSSYSTSPTVNGLSANEYYHVLIKDSYNCQIKDSVILSEPDPLLITKAYDSLICLNSNNGNIELTISGGTPPYNFYWSNGQNQEDLFDLAADKYSVIISDANNCSIQDSIEIKSAYPYDGEEICFVSVDNNTGKNMIVWEKTSNKGIVYYNIHRESTSTGVYELVGSQPYESYSTFIDETSNPKQRSYQYKLSVVDTCGNESELSYYHRTLLLTIGIGIGTYNLQWSNYIYEGGEFTFEKYYIYRGSLIESLQIIDSIAGNYNMYVDDNPPLSLCYYQIAGVKQGFCNPTGISKSKGEDYILIKSNIEANQTIDVTFKYGDNQTLKIYPNPFNNKTIIEFNNPSNDPYTLTLTDLSGKVVRIVDNITDSIYELDRESLSEGFYFVELRGKDIYRGKILIEL